MPKLQGPVIQFTTQAFVGRDRPMSVTGELEVVAASAEEGIATIKAELARLFGDKTYVITGFDARAEVRYRVSGPPETLHWWVTASIVTNEPVSYVPAGT